MGGLERAFGGSEKTDIMLDSQKWLLDKIASTVNYQTGRGVDQYGGTVTPGTNANLEAGFAGAQNALAPDQGMQAAIQRLISGGGDPQGVRDVYAAQLAPAQFAFQDQMREIGNRYGDTYGKTGALPYMQALAGARFGADQNATLANLVYQDRQAAENRSLGGLQAGVQVNQQNANNLQQLLATGDQQRGYEGQALAEDYQKWFGSQAYNNPWLQLAGVALGTQPKGQKMVGGIVPGTIGAIGGLAKMAGAGGGGAGGGA